MSVLEKIKIFITKRLPPAWLGRFRLLVEVVIYPINCIYDSYRYAYYSSTIKYAKNKIKLRAMLIKNFHAIEKGLSLSEPRPGFGQPVVVNTLKQLNKYIEHHGVDDTVFNTINTLCAFQKFNKRHGIVLEFLDLALDELSEVISQSQNHQGGVISVKRDKIISQCSGNFKQLANNRHSIRVFDTVPVSEDIIREAAEIAKKTPSVCNRQTAKIFVYGSKEKKNRLLALQSGNRGFGNLASHIVVITSDLQCFTGTGERNQAYVEGGLMAMSFVYALQSLGIGSCFLNWSVTADSDMALKKVAKIPASHVVVSLIAIGNIPSELKVAESPRLSLDQILHIQ